MIRYAQVILKKSGPTIEILKKIKANRENWNSKL